MTYELETREFAFRAESIDTDRREIIGRAVPYNEDANIAGIFIERFAPGSVQDSDDARLFWRHVEPIGRLAASEDSDGGWEIRARISATSLGNDALILARDGVVAHLSVGFEAGGEYEVEEREDDIPIITRTKVRVREVSLVPFPAYAGAEITEVRHESPIPKETPVMPETATPEDVLEVRESIEDLERRFSAFTIERPVEPVLDLRSAGEVLKAIAAGDESTIKSYNDMIERAYTGGTTALAPIKDSWVGDLTRLFDSSSGVLSQIFAEDTLPATGMNIEYAQLKSNNMKFDEQVNEGDNLQYGKVELETKTAPVKTFGGYTQLSRQVIERSTLPVLNRHMEALALAAGARQKVIVRAAFKTLHDSRLAAAGVPVILGATLAEATWLHWKDAIISGAIKFDGESLTIDDLVVSVSVFRRLGDYLGNDGRPLLVTDDNGSGVNTVGTLNLPGLTGALSGIRVVCDPGLTGDVADFVNGRAIRAYKSPTVSLQDENIINLSKDFSLYRYVAVAPEIPAGVVPIKLAAA